MMLRWNEHFLAISYSFFSFFLYGLSKSIHLHLRSFPVGLLHQINYSVHQETSCSHYILYDHHNALTGLLCKPVYVLEKVTNDSTHILFIHHFKCPVVSRRRHDRKHLYTNSKGAIWFGLSCFICFTSWTERLSLPTSNRQTTRTSSV